MGDPETVVCMVVMPEDMVCRSLEFPESKREESYV